MSTAMRNKQRLLRLLRYLYENTDEEHPVSTNELVEIFTDQNARATRKTIKDDLDILAGEGYDIVVNRSYYHSFFIGTREFELSELKLLIDAVASSRFITAEKSSRLIRKLSGFASRYQAEALTRHLYTAGRLKPDNEEIYYTVDQLNDAINQRRKVTFRYYDYTPAKVRILRHDGAPYFVSPYVLLWDDNHYYMVGHNDARDEINIFRVDRMCRTEITEIRAVPAPEDFDAEMFLQQVVRMFPGEEREVLLECRGEMMKSIIDRFGEEVETWPAGEDRFRVRARVSASQTFYAWVFQFAGRVRILGPEDVQKEYTDMLRWAMTSQSL